MKMLVLIKGASVQLATLKLIENCEFKIPKGIYLYIKFDDAHN
jgi:hypothetical protein